MRRRTTAILTASLVVGASLASSAQPADGFHTVLASAMRYVVAYEQKFSLLVSEELYVQELQRPTNPGTNLSRTNPGGGMQAPGMIKRQVLRSEFLLVQLGDGDGWMPFRDTFEVNGTKVRDREDRLVKLFLNNDAMRFDDAARIMQASTEYNIGNVSRTINIPTLALMFLHPRVNERFVFTDEGEENLNGRVTRRAAYREAARPTLIKTTRGRDLALTGHVWIDPLTGTVVKTDLNAADPAVRASVTVMFTRNDALEIWVPEKMEEWYKAALGLDEIVATATYSNVRRFTVGTSEKVTKPPGQR
ncbi:MAG: hypothetical protein ABI665_19080 [Vicinamibacterales bacterium]